MIKSMKKFSRRRTFVFFKIYKTVTVIVTLINSNQKTYLKQLSFSGKSDGHVCLNPTL